MEGEEGYEEGRDFQEADKEVGVSHTEEASHFAQAAMRAGVALFVPVFFCLPRVCVCVCVWGEHKCVAGVVRSVPFIGKVFFL